MTKKIVLDAGHGGTDPGATNGSRYESHDTLKMCNAVGAILRGLGQEVIYTRETDTYTSLKARTDHANATGADMFVSIHRNSFTNSTANGAEVWIYTTAGIVDEAAAAAVLEQLVAAGVQSNRGIKKGNYHVCRESNMTSMLVELGFISNAVDNRMFDELFDEYAQAIARGICNALGIDYSADGNNTQEPSENVYVRVQMGAFKSIENARNLERQLKEMGIECFLVIPESIRDSKQS